MSDVIMVYVTAESEEEAEKIIGTLLGEKLIACGNLLPSLRAFYVWEGEVKNEPEYGLILKTRADRFEDVRMRICELHSYDCPCIMAWPVSQGHGPFLEWVGEEASG